MHCVALSAWSCYNPGSAVKEIIIVILVPSPSSSAAATAALYGIASLMRSFLPGPPHSATCGPQIRDLESAFTNGLAAAAPSFLERYGASSDSPELDALPEEVQVGGQAGSLRGACGCAAHGLAYRVACVVGGGAAYGVGRGCCLQAPATALSWMHCQKRIRCVGR